MNLSFYKAAEIFEDNLEEIIQFKTQELRKDKEESLRAKIKSLEACKTAPNKKMTLELINLTHEANKKRHARKLREIRFLISRARNEVTDIDDGKIQMAKEYPIHDLYLGKLRKSGGSYYGKCPFHQETNASFAIKNNRFKCFGCGESGDSIDFVIKTQNKSFKEAVKSLLR